MKYGEEPSTYFSASDLACFSIVYCAIIPTCIAFKSNVYPVLPTVQRCMRSKVGEGFDPIILLLYEKLWDKCNFLKSVVCLADLLANMLCMVI